jgi:mono/diheme cytochrome c family protein
MRNTALVATVALWTAATALTAAQTRAVSPPRTVVSSVRTAAVPPPVLAAQRTLVDQYCVTCHNARLKTGGLALDGLDLAYLPDHAEVWEKVVRKVRAGVMPPQGVRRPDAAALQAFVGFVEDALDRNAIERPDPGRPLLHRLNRAEYKNAIRDLLALDVDVASLLPPDDSAYGFDNISDVLGVSPSLQERYLAAATRISAIAVGDPALRAGSDTYRVPQDLSQNQHVEGLPLGTVGGLRVRHMFPLDGEYDFQTKLYRTNLDMVRGLEYPSEFEIAIDGKPVHRVTIGGNPDLVQLFEKPTDTGTAVEARMRARVKVTAGPHDVTVAFVDHLAVKDTVRLQPFLRSSADNFDWAGQPHIQTVAITGPFNPTGSGDTPSRRAVFTCRPPSASGNQRDGAAAKAAERACAVQILSRLARRAYRQPVGPAELAPILQFYDEARARGTFESGIQRGLQRILSSPRFAFRVERDPEGAAPGTVHPVSGVELAGRLSFFLWSSIPDETLLRAAAAGTLSQPAVLERQVRRMLADPRAEALVSNFAGQWLQLRNVRSVQPNSDEFPDFDDNLRQAFRKETELLFTSILREDRSVLDLLRADYTFVNERLARHYGIAGVYGSRFRRVPVTDDTRRGILGQGSMLAVTSHAERTSPVLRGKWVLENLLGLPVPPPPPDVPALKGKEDGQKPRTLREQLAEHRADPVCASCHKVMDPVGFALENFDAVGAWRTREPGGLIDASGQLADGTPVNGVVTLRQAILAKPELFVTTMTEKLMTYALGRGVDARDMPAVRAILRDAAANDYRLSSIVLGVVRSVPFRMRITPGVDGETTRTAHVSGPGGAARPQ